MFEAKLFLQKKKKKKLDLICYYSHGFVPNGGRVYYLLRSQPPLLSPMVYEYYLATGDLDFVQEVSFSLCFTFLSLR